VRNVTPSSRKQWRKCRRKQRPNKRCQSYLEW